VALSADIVPQAGAAGTCRTAWGLDQPAQSGRLIVACLEYSSRVSAVTEAAADIF
jgi:hypothetical protein